MITAEGITGPQQFCNPNIALPLHTEGQGIRRWGWIHQQLHLGENKVDVLGLNSGGSILHVFLPSSHCSKGDDTLKVESNGDV